MISLDEELTGIQREIKSLQRQEYKIQNTRAVLRLYELLGGNSREELWRLTPSDIRSMAEGLLEEPQERLRERIGEAYPQMLLETRIAAESSDQYEAVNSVCSNILSALGEKYRTGKRYMDRGLDGKLRQLEWETLPHLSPI